MKKKVIIIGAGPSGLAAGYELSKNGFDVVVLEKDDIVGGLSKTINFKNELFDLGPHRFFTKNREVKQLWVEILGKDFLEVNRITRIYYKNTFFSYPVKPIEVLKKLGIVEAFKVAIDFFKAKFFLRNLKPQTIEDWITKNFGARLFKMFFKTYTEKVWGISCNEIEAEWAGQRIKNLSFLSAILHSLGISRSVKSLVEKFNYPRLGAGMMYAKMAEEIKKKGGKIICGAEVLSVKNDSNAINSVITSSKDGHFEWKADYFLSSMPITELIKNFSSKPPIEVSKAVDSLYYRSHITVNLIVNKKDIFPDNWIYVHEESVKMARLSSYTNFSKEMSKAGHGLIACEYFTFESDNLWNKKDEDLKSLAIDELEKLKFLSDYQVIDWFVLREKLAYPAYYSGYKNSLDIIRAHLERYKNFQTIGRGGMYRYNNMDHAILTGILAARNILGERNNLWQVNAEYEYHEEDKQEQYIKGN